MRGKQADRFNDLSPPQLLVQTHFQIALSVLQELGGCPEMGGAVWGKINSHNLSQTIQLKL